MKITLKQLKGLIRESVKGRLLKEYGSEDSKQLNDYREQLGNFERTVNELSAKLDTMNEFLLKNQYIDTYTDADLKDTIKTLGLAIEKSRPVAEAIEEALTNLSA